MTNRSAWPEKSPIERATEKIEANLDPLLHAAFNAHLTNTHFTRSSFARIVAGYFERKKFSDWLRAFGEQPTQDDLDASNDHQVRQDII